MQHGIIKKTLSLTLAFLCLLSVIPLSPLAPNALQSHTASSSQQDPNAYIIEEDVSKRGEFEKHFLCSDGTMVAVSYSEAVHQLSKDGYWVDVDNSFSYSLLEGRYRTKNKQFNVVLAADARNEKLIELNWKDYPISWSISTDVSTNNSDVANKFHSTVLNLEDAPITLQTTDKIDNRPIGRRVSAPDAFALTNVVGSASYQKLFGSQDNIGVNYTISNNKVEEDIIITAPTQSRVFMMNMNIGKLTAKLNTDGSVTFVDSDGNDVYQIGIPYMTDAKLEILNEIKVSVEQDGSNCTICLDRCQYSRQKKVKKHV